MSAERGAQNEKVSSRLQQHCKDSSARLFNGHKRVLGITSSKAIRQCIDWEGRSQSHGSVIVTVPQERERRLGRHVSHRSDMSYRTPSRRRNTDHSPCPMTILVSPPPAQASLVLVSSCLTLAERAQPWPKVAEGAGEARRETVASAAGAVGEVAG